jgi:hypothetical protein
MKKFESPGAGEAAHGAFETDELGWRVGSENSLLSNITQVLVCTPPRDVRKKLGQGLAA